jgi:hypothetical protein
MLNCSAFCALDPAPSPMTTRSVRFDTEPDDFPPDQGPGQ